MEQWSLELRAFDFNVAYHPGKDNQCADSLSRMPVLVMAWEGFLSTQQMIDGQEQVSILSVVRAQLAVDPNSALTSPSGESFPSVVTSNFGHS